VRDVKAGNLSLLMKWRWRLLNSGDRGLWKEVLVAKYGSLIVHNENLVIRPYPSFASIWWRDLCNLDYCVDSRNWISEVFKRTLGNGVHTQFWYDLWLGDSLLSVKFPDYFLFLYKRRTS
jgi:hypothetical protein